MPSYSKPEVVLVFYPFSDLTSAKVRPAVVVNAAHVPPPGELVVRLRGMLSCLCRCTQTAPTGHNVASAVKAREVWCMSVRAAGRTTASIVLQSQFLLVTRSNYHRSATVAVEQIFALRHGFTDAET